jgi:hypothetical protein
MNLVKPSGTVLLALATACSVTPRIDGTTTNPAAVTGTGTGLVPGTPGAVVGAPGTVAGVGVGAGTCAFDTRTVVQDQGGHFVEIITSRGRLFEFENGVPLQPGTSFVTPAFAPTVPIAPGMPVAPAMPGAVVGAGAVDLTSVPLYAQGPCAGLAPGMCAFDTHAFVLLPPGRLLEYVTAGGRQWVFESSQMTGAGLPLTAIPRYQPICGAFAGATGGLCVFDTRVFVKMGDQIIESITAYGRLFELDIEGNPLPNTGLDLTQSPKYASGPCQGSAPGQCALETRSYEPGPGGQLVETITSRGMLFTFQADTGAPAAPAVPMASRPYWAAGPCL